MTKTTKTILFWSSLFVGLGAVYLAVCFVHFWFFWEPDLDGIAAELIKAFGVTP